jgi:hypothetical protein
MSAELGFADGRIARREIGQHSGTAEGGVTAGWYRSPEILADFDVKGKARARFHLEDKIGTEGNLLAEEIE